MGGTLWAASETVLPLSPGFLTRPVSLPLQGVVIYEPLRRGPAFEQELSLALGFAGLPVWRRNLPLSILPSLCLGCPSPAGVVVGSSWLFSSFVSAGAALEEALAWEGSPS